MGQLEKVRNSPAREGVRDVTTVDEERAVARSQRSGREGEGAEVQLQSLAGAKSLADIRKDGARWSSVTSVCSAVEVSRAQKMALRDRLEENQGAIVDGPSDELGRSLDVCVSERWRIAAHR